MSTRRTPMQVTVESLVAQAGLQDAYSAALEEGYGLHLAVKIEHFDRLVIEVVGLNQVSVAHYYTQNGDAMRDPEIVFTLPHWKAIEYTQDNLGLYQRAPEGSYLPSANSFARQWAVNIRNQGFEQGEMSSATHAIN